MDNGELESFWSIVNREAQELSCHGIPVLETGAVQTGRQGA